MGSAVNRVDRRVVDATSAIVVGALALVRVMLSPQISVVRFELYDLNRFNMMSQHLSSWFALASLSLCAV